MPEPNATMLDSDDVPLLREIVAVPVSTAAPPTLAVLRTEYAANDLPRLPVRDGTHALVWLTRSRLQADVPAEVARIENLRLRSTDRSTLY